MSHNEQQPEQQPVGQRQSIQLIDMTTLMAIYLSAFKSGIASTVINMTGSEEAGQNLADRVLEAMEAEPLTMLEVENQIREIVTGTDSGEVGWQIPLGNPPGGVTDA